MLLARTELTAGSACHATGLLPRLNMRDTVGQLHKDSVDLYKRLKTETGQEVSVHVTGIPRLATKPDRMDEHLKYCGVPKRCVTIEVHGVTDADPLGYIAAAHAVVGKQREIEILGQRKQASMVIESPLDPDNAKLRA